MKAYNGSTSISNPTNYIPPYQPLYKSELTQQFRLESQENNATKNGDFYIDALKGSNNSQMKFSPQNQGSVANNQQPSLIQSKSGSLIYSSRNPSLQGQIGSNLHPQQKTQNSLLERQSQTSNSIQSALQSTQSQQKLEQTASYHSQSIQNLKQPLTEKNFQFGSSSKSPLNSGLRSLTQFTPTQKNIMHQELNPMNSTNNQEKGSTSALYPQNLSCVSPGNEENIRTTNLLQNPKNSLAKMAYQFTSPETTSQIDQYPQAQYNTHYYPLQQQNRNIMDTPNDISNLIKEQLIQKYQQTDRKQHETSQNFHQNGGSSKIPGNNSSTIKTDSSLQVLSTGLTTNCNTTIPTNCSLSLKPLSNLERSQSPNSNSNERNNNYFNNKSGTPKSPSYYSTKIATPSGKNTCNIFNQSHLYQDQSISLVDQSNLLDSHPLNTTSQTSQDTILLTQKCSNHPDKKAKYIISDDQSNQNNNTFVCSKCAVELSKHGYTTINISDYLNQLSIEQSSQFHNTTATPGQEAEIQQNEQSSQNTSQIHSSSEAETQIKFKEIEAFLKKFNSQSSKWQEINHALMVKKKDVNNFYDRQQSRIEQQYKEYLDIITQIRDQNIQLLISNKEKTDLTYQHWEQQSKESLTELTNIKTDIELNVDNVVNFIQLSDFNKIIGAYYEQLDKKMQFFQSLSNECLDLIKFNNQGVSPMNIAPQIEQSFQMMNFTTTLVKKRVSEYVAGKKKGQLVQNNSLLNVSNNNSSFQSSHGSRSLSPIAKQGSTMKVSLGQQNGSILSGDIRQQYNFNKPSSPMVQQITDSEKNTNSAYPHTIIENSNNQLGLSEQSSHLQISCNSPIKIDQTAKNDLTEKQDIYVSFGNNKDLIKAAQQAKILLINPQQTNNVIIAQSLLISRENKEVQQNQASTGAIQNDQPIYFVEDESNKSQPNTPELKQIEEIPSKIVIGSSNQSNSASVEQQKPFRTLFGDEDTHNNENNLINENPEKQQQNESSTSPALILQSPTINQQHQVTEQIVQNNGNGNLIGSRAKFNSGYGFKQGSSSVSSKSPRYSIVECENQEGYGYEDQDQRLPINKNSSQLEQYLNNFGEDNLKNITQDQSFTSEGPQQKEQIHQINGVQDKEEDMDNPLLSSPNYKQ